MDHKAILNTWKEIAQYVGRSARTIQRWERNLGFPVHRPHGRARSAILAIPSEIDAWVRSTPGAAEPKAETKRPARAKPARKSRAAK